MHSYLYLCVCVCYCVILHCVRKVALALCVKLLLSLGLLYIHTQCLENYSAEQNKYMNDIHDIRKHIYNSFFALRQKPPEYFIDFIFFSLSNRITYAWIIQTHSGHSLLFLLCYNWKFRLKWWQDMRWPTTTMTTTLLDDSNRWPSFSTYLFLHI
jgi:hypothetical protein